jgi:hypothetical protein
MEGVKNLEYGPEEPPGVEGAERSEGDSGNWGGPTQPGELRKSSEGRCPITGEEPGNGQRAGRASEAVILPLLARWTT